MVDLEDFEYFWLTAICSDEALVDLVPYSESRFLTFKRAQAWTSGNDIKKGSGIQKLGKTSNKRNICEENTTRESRYWQSGQQGAIHSKWANNKYFREVGGVVNNIWKFMNIAGKSIHPFVQLDAQQQMRSWRTCWSRAILLFSHKWAIFSATSLIYYIIQN